MKEKNRVTALDNSLSFKHINLKDDSIRSSTIDLRGAVVYQEQIHPMRLECTQDLTTKYSVCCIIQRETTSKSTGKRTYDAAPWAETETPSSS